MYSNVYASSYRDICIYTDIGITYMYGCVYNRIKWLLNIWEARLLNKIEKDFILVSLFNGISTFVCYLMSKPLL